MYSPTMRYVVGIVELAGAILVLRERFALPGALLLFGVTLFAAFHVVGIDHNPLPLSILVLLTGGLIVVEGRNRRSRADARRRGRACPACPRAADQAVPPGAPSRIRLQDIDERPQARRHEAVARIVEA